MLSKTAAIALRVVQAVLAIIVLGLSAAGISALSDIYTCGYYDCYYTSANSPVLDFALFTSVWTVLVGIWVLVLAFTVKKGTYSGSVTTNPLWDWGTFAGDLVATLAWFATFILLAVSAGISYAEVDSSNSDYGVAGAGAAFAGVSWVFAMVLFIFDCLDLKNKHRMARPSTGTTQPNVAAAETGQYYGGAGEPAPRSPSVASPKPSAPSEAGGYYGGQGSVPQQTNYPSSETGGYYGHGAPGNNDMSATVNAPVSNNLPPELDHNGHAGA